MAQKNVAILSLMASLKDNSGELTSSVKKMYEKVEKNAGGIDIDLNDEKVKKSLDHINSLISKKLNKVDLTKQLHELVDAFTNPTNGAEDYLVAIQNIENELGKLAKYNKDGQLINLNSKDISNVLNVINKIDEAQNKLNEKQKNSKKAVEDLKNQYKLTNTEIVSLMKNMASKSTKGADLNSALGIDAKEIKASEQTTINTYQREVDLFKELLSKKSDISKITTTEDARENLKLNQQLFDLYEKIIEDENKLKGKYKIQDQNLLSHGFDSNITSASLNNNIDKASQKLIGIMSSRQSKALQNAESSVNSIISLLNGNTDNLNDNTSLISDDDLKDIEQYIVDIDKCKEKLKELYTQTQTKQSVTEEKSTNKDINLYYARLQNLMGENVDLKEMFPGFENKGFIRTISNTVSNMENLDDETKKTIETIKNYKKETSGNDSGIINNNETETGSNSSNENLTELTQRMEVLESTISEMQDKLKTLDGNAFNEMKSNIETMNNELDKTIKKIDVLTSENKNKSLDEKLASEGLTVESATQLANQITDKLKQDDQTGEYTQVDNLMDTVTNYNKKVQETNAYLQKGNELVEERAILLKKGLQVGDEYVMSDSTGKVNIGNGISKYGADSVLHTHAYSESTNNLRFSDADIKGLVDGSVKKALLMCGQEIETLDMTNIDSGKLSNLQKDILDVYTVTFARFGAEVKDGKITNIDSLSPEIQNQATDIINALTKQIIQGYGGDLYFDQLDPKDKMMANDDKRIHTIDQSELNLVNQYIEAMTKANNVQEVETNIIALQKKLGVLKEIKDVESKNNTQYSEESTGQLSFFDNLESKSEESSNNIESDEKEKQDIINSTNEAIKGQIDLFDLLAESKKEAASVDDGKSKKQKQYEKKNVADDAISKDPELASKRAKLVQAKSEEEKTRIENSENEVIKSWTNFYDSANNLVKVQIKSIKETFDQVDNITDTIRFKPSKDGGTEEAYASTIVDSKVKTSVVKDLSQAEKDAYKINDALSQTISLMSQVNNSTQGFEQVFAVAQEKVDSLNKRFIDGKITLDTYNSGVQSIVNSLSNTVGVADTWDEAQISIQKYVNSLDDGKIKDWNKENQTCSAEYKTQDGQIQQLTFSYGKMGNAIIAVEGKSKQSVGAISKFFDGLKNKWQEVLRYLLSFASLYQIWNVFRQGISTITELDTAFTEMRKVSDESVKSLKSFQKESFNIADSVGTTSQQIQNSTADWMRLGESIDQAKESAKDANILLNVSEFESIDEATESLVSMSQAYKDLDKMEIIDKLNNIGNNFSISTNDLATGLQNAAGTLSAMGNNFDEIIALETAGNSIIQDTDKVAAGLRTISLRIVGTTSAAKELEEIGEDTSDYVVQTASKLEETIKKLTAVESNGFEGFDILDDNGNYKSTYEIMLGIAQVYKEIQESDKKLGNNRATELIETLAGKNRSAIAASILQNPEMLKEVYDSSSNSEGSAEKELNKYLDSIEGKMQQFKNSVQKIWYDLISSDTIKGFVDFGTKAINFLDSIINKFGTLGTVIATIVTALTVKNGIKNGGGRARKLISWYNKKGYYLQSNIDKYIS